MFIFKEEGKGVLKMAKKFSLAYLTIPGTPPVEQIRIAKECGKELTAEQARELYDKLKAAASGELSDEDLEAVAGGWGSGWIFPVF